uniref:Coiled-coil domain containing 12 n=1 Tax=Eptatretus burgeri TaxID=7764 RepID=A0A8C4Q273_EPTBU
MAGKVGVLQEAALQRKERLKILREKHSKEASEGEEPEEKRFAAEEPVKFTEIKLRSYTPQDEQLKDCQLPKIEPVLVEDKVEEQLQASKPMPIIEEVDLTNLAPRKPDWDLKRDVAKKLDKMEKRTQRAIAELIRERLKGKQDDLVAAIAMTNQNEADSD